MEIPFLILHMPSVNFILGNVDVSQIAFRFTSELAGTSRLVEFEVQGQSTVVYGDHLSSEEAMEDRVASDGRAQ